MLSGWTPQKKFSQLGLLFYARNANCAYLLCVTTLLILFVALLATFRRQSLVLTRISKLDLDLGKIREDASDTFVIKHPNGGAYIAFQIPESSQFDIASGGGIAKSEKRGQTSTKQFEDSNQSDNVFKPSFPLSIRNDPYAINNENVCRGVKDLEFIVLVHSSTRNVMRRCSIRETWANYRILKKYSMRIVFILGKPEDNSTQNLIEHENSVHKDIIQGTFLDTYRNLTHKGVLGIRWVYEFCKESKIVVKVDDDVFVNVFKLMDDVINKHSKQSRKILCPLREKGTSLIERHEGKWRIGDSDFKNMTYYPVTYCNGFFVIFTADLLPEMVNAALSTPFFWIDDVYVYGLLLEKVKNVTYVQLPHLSLNEGESLSCFESRNKTCDLLVGNASSDEGMDKLWDLLLGQYSDFAKRYVKTALFENFVF